jgi:hypothetical protein
MFSCIYLIKVVIVFVFNFRINEACVLLCLRVGSALLLREVLMSDDSVPEKEQALQDIGVYKLPPQVALNVLNSRTNLSVT